MNSIHEQFIVEENIRLIDAIRVIKQSKHRCAIVVSGKRVTGVISEGDILEALLHDTDVHAEITDWINRSFLYLTNPDYDKMFNLVKKHGITLIPVVNADFELQSVVSFFDVLERAQLNSGKQ